MTRRAYEVTDKPTVEDDKAEQMSALAFALWLAYCAALVAAVLKAAGAACG